jgi:hypothetical protein
MGDARREGLSWMIIVDFKLPHTAVEDEIMMLPHYLKANECNFDDGSTWRTFHMCPGI